MRRQADFFCGKLNGITFPYSPGRIHFVAFLLKVTGTKNSMITAINHPNVGKNKAEARKFSFLQISTFALEPIRVNSEGKCRDPERE